MLGGAQGNTGTVIIGKNPIIDNPLDPWWDAQGAYNSAAGQVSTDKKFFSGVSNTVSTAANATNDVFSFTKVLGNLQLWKGVGLVLAGVLILLIVGLQLVKL